MKNLINKVLIFHFILNIKIFMLILNIALKGVENGRNACNSNQEKC